MNSTQTKALHTVIAILPIDSLIETLEEVLQKYKKYPSKDNLESIALSCHSIMLKLILMQKGANKNPMEAAQTLSDEIDEIKRATRFFQTDKN